MGKSKGSKKVNTDLDNEYSYQQQQRTSNNARYDQQAAEANANADESRGLYSGSLAGLGDIAGSFMGGVGDIDTSALAGDSAAYKKFASGDSDQGRFYHDLLKTGGYTADDLANMRAEGNSQVPEFFSNLRNMYSTQNAATGGYSPGYGAQMAKLSRDAAREGQDAARRTELGVNESVRTGKLAGATGLDSEFLGGMAGATGADSNIVQANLAKMGMDLQSRGIGAGLYGQQTSGYGNLAEMDAQKEANAEAMRMKSQGYSDAQIQANIAQRGERYPNKGGVNWGKIAKVAAAAAATYFTGGAAAPLLGMALASGNKPGGGGYGNAGPPPSNGDGGYG